MGTQNRTLILEATHILRLPNLKNLAVPPPNAAPVGPPWAAGFRVPFGRKFLQPSSWVPISRVISRVTMGITLFRVIM